MPKGTNQKFKLYRLAQIMLENTDDEHYITMPEILSALGEYEITADRKSIYNDLRDLEVLGIEVEGEPVGNRYHYHVVDRPFELPELKLLVDAIQSSKFITERKTNALIRKLEKLVSRYEAVKLQRQVYVSGRIKTMNESIYYTVDAIYNAISENRKIRFQYFQWNVKKEPELRHNGAWYHISPWGLSWDNENYYLVGYDSDAELIKHYRYRCREREYEALLLTFLIRIAVERMECSSAKRKPVVVRESSEDTASICIRCREEIASCRVPYEIPSIPCDGERKPIRPLPSIVVLHDELLIRIVSVLIIYCMVESERNTCGERQ